MEITDTIKAILQSISGRSNKYWEFWLSKYEYEKYWLTERSLRTIIEKLRNEWYIQWVRYEYFKWIEWDVRKRNIFIATEKLTDLLKTFTKKIVDLNDKIIEWCKKQDIRSTLSSHGIELFKWRRIGKKWSSITYSDNKKCISDWKTWKKWNLFNYLKEFENQSTLEFYKNFVWI